MTKMLPKLLLAAILSLGATAMQADNVVIKLGTSKALGSELTFGFPMNVSATIDWGDGNAQTYRASEVTGTLKGDTITVSGTSFLTGFDCHGQNVSWIDLSGASSLISLDCSNNELTKLTLTGSTALEELDCSNNKLTSLTCTKSSSLRSLLCAGNSLTSANIIPCNSLEVIDISDNSFTSLALTPKSKLRSLWAANNKLSTLSFSNYAPLQSLVCYGNTVKTLSYSQKSYMQDFWMQGATLSQLDFSDCADLKTLDVRATGIDSLVLSSSLTTTDPMQYIDCSENHLSFKNIYNRSLANTYICGNQTDISMPDTVKAGTYVDFSRFAINGSNQKNGTLAFYDAESESALKSGSSAKTADYTMVASAGRVKFFKIFPSVYLTVTSKNYPDLLIKTVNFVVYDEDIAVTGIDDIVADGGINYSVDGGVLTLFSGKSQKASVVSTDGTVMWQGTVDASGVDIALAPGIYIVGQKKIVVK